MKLFARPRTEDLSPVVVDLRAQLLTARLERDMAQQDADDKADRLAVTEIERDRLAERVERQREAIEALTAERDKAASELVATRFRLAEELNELRKAVEVERQDFAARSRAHGEAAKVVAEREAILIKDCDAAAAALKNMLVTLGR